MSTEFWAGVIFTVAFTLITGIVFAMLGGRLSRFYDSWSEKRAIDNLSRNKRTVADEFVQVRHFYNDRQDFYLYIVQRSLLLLVQVIGYCAGLFVAIPFAMIVLSAGQLIDIGYGAPLRNLLDTRSESLLFGLMALFSVVLFIMGVYLVIGSIWQLFRLIRLIWRVRRYETYKTNVADDLTPIYRSS